MAIEVVQICFKCIFKYCIIHTIFIIGFDTGLFPDSWCDGFIVPLYTMEMLEMLKNIAV